MRLRFTIRRMMIVVIVLAVALGVFRYRCNALARLARSHRRTAEESVSTLDRFVESEIPRDSNYQKTKLFLVRLAEYRWNLADKYAYAASHPWLSIEPDPPEPK